MTTDLTFGELAPRRKRYLIADTETDGISKDKRACEVALMEINPVTLEVINTWESLIDPKTVIPQVVIDIHGITNEMVKDAPTWQEYLDIVLAGEFKNDDLIMICHNASFDVPLLVELGPIVHSVCTLFWARQLIKDSPNHKLGTLREHFDFPENEAHRALADCHTTRRLLKVLLERAGRSLADFAATTEQTVHTQPWGKHKGQLVMTLPVGYLIWLWNLDDLEPNLRDTVKKALAVHGFKPKKLAKIEAV